MLMIKVKMSYKKFQHVQYNFCVYKKLFDPWKSIS